MPRILTIFFLGLFMSTVSYSKVETMPFPEIWQTGKLEDTFKKAEQEKKFVFLYWGAVWCPPCNALKSEVFAKPKFKELSALFIPFYLDGDSETAQTWGEKFQISGYPTILLLNPSQKELMRISTGMNIEEFENTIKIAIDADKTMSERIELLLSKKGTDHDWKIVARTDSWGSEKKSGWTNSKTMTTRKQLLDIIPKHLTDEKVMISNQLLLQYVSLDDKQQKENQTFVSNNKEMITESIKTMLAHPVLSRSYIIWSSDEVLGWAHKNLKAEEFKAISKNWLDANSLILNHKDTSSDEKFGTTFPMVTVFKLEHPKDQIPTDLKNKIVELGLKIVKEIDQDYYKKHASISTIAYKFGEIGAFDEGRKVLLEEIKTTDTPWYYQSSLSSLEEKAKDTKQALYWSEQAKKSALGNSTKLQWIRAHVAKLAKLETVDRLQKIEANLEEYYSLAFKLEDGFEGRNGKAFHNLDKTFVKGDELKAVTQYMERKAKQCTSLNQNSQKACQEYFKVMLSPAPEIKKS